MIGLISPGSSRLIFLLALTCLCCKLATFRSPASKCSQVKVAMIQSGFLLEQLQGFCQSALEEKIKSQEDLKGFQSKLMESELCWKEAEGAKAALAKELHLLEAERLTLKDKLSDMGGDYLDVIQERDSLARQVQAWINEAGLCFLQ